MRLGVMCSGNGTNFENIVHACPKHDVVLMVYNKKKAKAAKRAERLDIPSCYCKNEDDIITLSSVNSIVIMLFYLRT